MGTHCCGECYTEYELDLESKMLICPNCGCTWEPDDDEIAEWDGEYYSGERLDVHDAALIWRSRGKDEDYMFGYTEDELENA